LNEDDNNINIGEDNNKIVNEDNNFLFSNSWKQEWN